MKSKLSIIALLSIFLLSCSGGKMEEKQVDYNALKDVPASAWEKLSKKKIYFGHQSVGFNIIDGVKDIIKENPAIKLNIVETSSPSDFNKGVFAHSRVGKNTDSKSKVDEFLKFLKNGIGKHVDIAFLKFCFIDVSAGTEVQENFEYYKKYISQLNIEYPETTFIHITVPLTTMKTTWKTRLKIAIGKEEIWEYDDNIRRNEYNRLLIKEYTNKEPVFDIAAIESTFSDGTSCTFEKNGKLYSSMVPEYTNDGGHLNKTGQKKVAEQLLLLLANL